MEVGASVILTTVKIIANELFYDLINYEKNYDLYMFFILMFSVENKCSFFYLNFAKVMTGFKHEVNKQFFIFYLRHYLNKVPYCDEV